MAQEFLNVLDPQYTRYIHLRGEIEAYLAEKYGAGIDFQVVHESDRWSFRAPEELSKKQVKAMTKEIVARREHAQRQAENQAPENDTVVPEGAAEGEGEVV